MNIETLYSSNPDLTAAVSDLKNQAQQQSYKAGVYFASSNYDPATLSPLMQEAFTSVPLFGSTTAGELVSGKMLDNSIVLMLWDDDVLEDIVIGVAENIKEGDPIPEVFKKFATHTGQSMEALDFTQYVGIIIEDGLSVAEEKCMDVIGNLTNIQFIGGSAGDDIQFKCTHVFADGKAYTNAAVLALLKPRHGFDIIKTQSFTCTEKILTATEVDETKRTVIAFNDQPAALAYADALGAAQDDLPGYFQNHPVGLLAGNEIFVRSPQQVQGDKVVFYCQIKEGMQLHVLESTNIVEDTQKALDDKLQELGSIRGLINFHCILRTLELKTTNQTEAYGEIFKDVAMIGFSTYGESYIGHINQTSTMLVFK